MDQLLSRGSGTPDKVSRETVARIRTVFAASLQWDRGGEGLTYEEMLDEAASLDSIAVLEFLTAVEKEFGVELEPAVLEFEFLRDIAALAAYVEDRISSPSGSETEQGDRPAAHPND
jgi:acyl carrier protein